MTEINAKSIINGDEIKDISGKWHLVQHVYDNIVYVSGSQLAIHVSKIIEVKKGK